MTIQREVNEYLFYEFGFDLDADDSTVRDDWPFPLEAVGRIESSDGILEVFRFQDGEDEFYATGGKVFDVFRTGGMGFDDLRLAALGSRWIAEREPVGLDTAVPTDPQVPSGRERRSAIERLAQAAFPTARSFRIVEGRFLRRTGSYLALVADAESPEEVVLVGANFRPQRVGFPEASKHRRLCWAVGQLVEQGGIHP